MCLHVVPTVYDIRTADGEFDAAEVDKELISTRLRQDVLEQSGKVHLFIADTVSRVHFASMSRHLAVFSITLPLPHGFVVVAIDSP